MNEQPLNNTAPPASIDPDEISRFSAMADSWWDPNGKFKPLHALGPVRIHYIKTTFCAHFKRDPNTDQPLKGLRILDIGCGGGLLCEPMAQLGATIVGADATEKNIAVAQVHAQKTGVDIDYRHTSAEDLASLGEKFDAILNMEVIEHVADVGSFLSACRSLLNDNGIMMLSTLNRTPKSFIFAIVGAEYILGWLPKGTHTWDKFIKPSELAKYLTQAHFKLDDLKGIEYQPFSDIWRESDDLSVNYMGYAKAISQN